MHSNLTEEQRQQLDQLVTVFLATNAHINLSALRTEEACRIGNVEDSLACLESMDTHIAGNDGKTLIDIGTGGGFPLLPLAIALPHWRMTGLDSTGKKLKAVRQIADDVGISTITLITERAEQAGHDPLLREQFDVATARAVAKIPELLEYCSAFVKTGGIIVLWKSLHIEEELASSGRAQRVFSCPLVAAHRYALGGDWGERQLLVFRKEEPLKKMYPRRGGLAKKEPVRSV